MPIFKMNVKEFKKMSDPVDRENGHEKYVCYIQAASIPEELSDWMETNPRDQKMTTGVARAIRESLEENQNFHELNRGIVLSAEAVRYNNQTGVMEVEFLNNDIHGNIDGGHTMRAIFEAQRQGSLVEERYVFAEIFTGILSPVDLAAARNTSVQVDLKSIEELKNSFAVIKHILKPLSFNHRVAYKMNEHYGDGVKNPIDVREIITILNMFNQALYPLGVDGTSNTAQPIQSYTGKEVSLKRFLDLGKEKREEIILNMQPIIGDIFNLWDQVECEFAGKSSLIKRKYGSKKYSKYDNGNVVGQALFSERDLCYLVPKGILYPVVGAFRALVRIDPVSKKYYWKTNPLMFWKESGQRLVAIVMDEKEDNPEYLGKSSNLWSNLFKEVLINTISFI